MFAIGKEHHVEVCLISRDIISRATSIQNLDRAISSRETVVLPPKYFLLCLSMELERQPLSKVSSRPDFLLRNILLVPAYMVLWKDEKNSVLLVKPQVFQIVVSKESREWVPHKLIPLSDPPQFFTLLFFSTVGANSLAVTRQSSMFRNLVDILICMEGAFQFYVAQNWSICDILSVCCTVLTHRLWYNFYGNWQNKCVCAFWYIMWFNSQYSAQSNDPTPQSIVWRMDYSHWIALNIDYGITWCTKSYHPLNFSVEIFNGCTKSTRTHACHNVRHLKLEPAWYRWCCSLVKISLWANTKVLRLQYCC